MYSHPTFRLKYSAVAVALILPMLSGTVFAEEAPAETVDGSSIYSERQHSIYDGNQTKKDPAAVVKRERETGMTRLVGNVHEAMKNLERQGVIAPLVDKDGKPLKGVRFKVNGPTNEVDSEGRPMTLQQVEERKNVHEMAFEMAKAMGYSWEEQQKKLKDRPLVPEDWAKKTEETKRYIAEHGPITSKRFFRPGYTMAENEAMDQAKAYRRINGEWVLIDEKGNPVLTQKRREEIRQGIHRPLMPETNPVERKPLTRVTTKLTRRKARSSDVQTMNETKAAEYQAPLGDNFINELVDGRVSHRNPNLTVSEIEKLFPDLKKNGSVTLKEEWNSKDGPGLKDEAPNPKSKPVSNNGIPVSLIEGLTGLLFGIQSAQASEIPEGYLPEAANSQKRIQLSDGTVICPGEKDQVCSKPSTEDEVKSVKGFASDDGREYRAKMIEDAFKSADIPVNKYTEEMGAVFDSIAQDLAKEERRITEAVVKSKDKEKYQSSLPPVEGSEEDRPYLDELTERMEETSDDNRAAEAAQFAADIVHRTGSLTKDEFDEDVAMVTNLLTSKVTGEAYIGELRKLLQAHPEIYNIAPDADKQLDALASEHFGLGTPPEKPNGTTTYVFVSLSLGDKVLKELFDAASFAMREDLIFVFRGVPEGKTINDGIFELHKMAKDLNPTPNIILDPSLFKAYDVTMVPTVVRANGYSALAEALAAKGATPMTKRNHGKMVAKVEGLDNDTWLMERIEAGERGDLGLKGDVREISEPDLIEVLKAKAMEVDWESKRQAAIKNAWKHQKFIELKTADKARTRKVDPTILVDRDLLDLAGNPIRKAGDRVNPLQIQPFTLRLLVFDPLSREEMRRVNLFLSRNKLMGKGAPVLIATRIDKEKGWDSYTKLTDQLDQHVFVLNEEVQKTFDLEATPSLVYADNKEHVFIVEELGPIEGMPKEK